MARMDLVFKSDHLEWQQGCLLSAHSMRMVWQAWSSDQQVTEEEGVDRVNTPVTWTVKETVLNNDDYLIIISQTRDLYTSAAKEPYVETIRVFRTSDKGIINEAATTSGRHFLLTSISVEGREEALIADATVHIHLAKDDLFKLAPLSCFKDTDTVTPRMFQMWLTKRYYRQALPDEVVDAIQKPIVKSIRKLSKTHDFHRIFRGIWSIRFILHTDRKPYKVEMLFIQSEHPDAPLVTEEDAATLANWLADVLKKATDTEIIAWSLVNMKNTSLYVFFNSYELHRDVYTIKGDAEEG